MREPKIHADGTPEWETPSREHLVQYVDDHPLSAIRLYQIGEINWDWTGTVEEAEQIAEAFISAIAYAKKEQG